MKKITIKQRPDGYFTRLMVELYFVSLVARVITTIFRYPMTIIGIAVFLVALPIMIWCQD